MVRPTTAGRGAFALSAWTLGLLGVFVLSPAMGCHPGASQASAPDPLAPDPPAPTSPNPTPHPVKSYPLSSSISLRVEAERATLLGAGAERSNPRLVRLPMDTMQCMADGFLGVDVHSTTWALRQVHCSGALLLSETLTFSLPSAGQPVALVAVEVRCVNRFAPTQDALVYALTASELSGQVFENVALAALYQKLDFSGCDELSHGAGGAAP